MYYFATCILFMCALSVCGDRSSESDPWRHLPKECGKTRYDNQRTRIVGGTKAQLGQFPWMARVGLKQRGKKDFFHCGGSLINRFYVISAAHCGEVGNIVRLGENDVKTLIDCDEFGCAPPYQDIEIMDYKFSNYCRTSHVNDIMLIELKSPAKFNDFVQPICLPRGLESMDSLVNHHVVLAGWGAVNGSDPSQGSKHLDYLIAPIISFEACKKKYPTVFKDKQICLGQSEKGGNVCNGDSGGPAFKSMLIDGMRRTYLLGIASYVQAHCKGGAVYTNILYYLNSVLNEIKKS